MAAECPETAFVVPAELTAPAPAARAPLARLPAELLLIIFAHAADPVDRVCLALASRRLLQVAAPLGLRVPSAAGHRGRPACRRVDGLLRRLWPADARGRPKRTLGLCCDCLRYRPRRAARWRATPRADAGDGCWSSVVASWKAAYAAQCPECWAGERRAELERCARATGATLVGGQ